MHLSCQKDCIEFWIQEPHLKKFYEASKEVPVIRVNCASRAFLGREVFNLKILTCRSIALVLAWTIVAQRQQTRLISPRLLCLCCMQATSVPILTNLIQKCFYNLCPMLSYILNYFAYFPLLFVYIEPPFSSKCSLLPLCNKLVRFLWSVWMQRKQVVLFLQQIFYPPWLIPYLAAFLTIVEALTPSWAAICRVVRNWP